MRRVARFLQAVVRWIFNRCAKCNATLSRFDDGMSACVNCDGGLA